MQLDGIEAGHLRAFCGGDEFLLQGVDLVDRCRSRHLVILAVLKRGGGDGGEIAAPAVTEHAAGVIELKADLGAGLMDDLGKLAERRNEAVVIQPHLCVAALAQREIDVGPLHNDHSDTAACAFKIECGKLRRDLTADRREIR